MNKVVYNPLKLSEYRPLFHDLHVLVIGAGAVGTHLMEKFAKMGLSPDAMDFDCFTLENAAKHGCLIRTPEDAGRNKAECASNRVQPLLDDGCTSNGIDSDLCKLGPEAFADYSYVVAAVDNFDAKVLLNELIRQLPEERRPIVIMDGTHDEMAQSVILDNAEFCLRCLIDEGWMKDSSIRTSCTGPQVRQVDGAGEIVRTSNLASSMAAHLSAEQLRASVIGHDGVMNRRLTYTAYPHLELSVAHPMRKRNCPGCAIHPPARIEWLHGSVLNVTLREAMEQIAAILGTTDFEVSVHRLNYRKVVYAGFIVEDVCHSCGAPIQVMQHEGRVFPDDLRCETCAAANAPLRPASDFDHREPRRAFTWGGEETIQQMMLYDLGYPLGAHIEVIQRNGALDFLDAGKITRTIFAFDGDHLKMHEIHKL